MYADLVNAGGVTVRMDVALAGQVEARTAARPWTPNETLPGGGTRVHAKRVCNGCGASLGDLIDADLQEVPRHDCADADDKADDWEPCWCNRLPIFADVRAECPICTPQPGRALTVIR